MFLPESSRDILALQIAVYQQSQHLPMIPDYLLLLFHFDIAVAEMTVLLTSQPTVCADIDIFKVYF